MSKAKSTVQSQVPDAGTPIFNQQGYIDPVWHQFFFTLLRRTGGSEGVDAGSESDRITHVEERIDDAEREQEAMVPVYRPMAVVPQDVSQSRTSIRLDELQRVQTHGIQSDPALHDVSTPNSNGFMSAADKGKLDTIASGSSVASVTGTAPIASSGGANPAISISAATPAAAGSQSAVDKTRIDALSATSSPTFAALTTTNGQLTFPATQVPSAGATTLDDYREGTWSPVLTFVTPGNLAVTYSIQEGVYTKVGRMVTLTFFIATSAFTFTTASGSLILTGVPFITSVNSQIVGSLSFSGVTKSGYTQFCSRIVASTTQIDFICSASGVGRSVIDSTNTPSGTNVAFNGTITYFV